MAGSHTKRTNPHVSPCISRGEYAARGSDDPAVYPTIAFGSNSLPFPLDARIAYRDKYRRMATYPGLPDISSRANRDVQGSP